MNKTLKEKALEFATKAHEGQFRKLTGKPMIGHPINVASTLEAAGFSIETVIAGFLHDVVEDTKITAREIEAVFGKEVLRIVMGNTEDKTKTWEERKQHTIDWVKIAPIEIKALIAADKLDNLRSLVEGFNNLGEKVWSKFNRGYEQQKWYFTGVCDNLFFGLNKNEIPEFFYEYKELVDSFFR